MAFVLQGAGNKRLQPALLVICHFRMKLISTSWDWFYLVSCRFHFIGFILLNTQSIISKFAQNLHECILLNILHLTFQSP